MNMCLSKSPLMQRILMDLRNCIEGKELGMKLKSISCILSLSLVLCGCQEVERPMNQESGNNFIEKVNLSEIVAPDQVFVYSAKCQEINLNRAANAFLGENFKESEVYAEGRCYVKDSGTKDEKSVIFIDGGISYFGESGHAADNGIVFSGIAGYRNVLENSAECESVMEEYATAGNVSGIELSGKEEVSIDFVDMTLQYLKKIGMDKYEPDQTVSFKIDEIKEKTCSVLFFRQKIDGLFISDVIFENMGRKIVYNYRNQMYNTDLTAISSVLKVMYVGNELVSWENYEAIKPEKKLKKYKPVSAIEAYESVKECYRLNEYIKVKPTLERAEIQYELIKLEDRLYLYPIWLFAMRGEDDNWDYFLVDAVTGGLFKDIPDDIVD